MDFSDTYIDFLSDDLVSDYGETKGGELYRASCEKYEALCAGEKRYENEAMNRHVFGNILPGIALYSMFCENGSSKEEAYELALKETQKNARRLREKNKKLGSMPFAFGLFKLFVKSYMKKYYPPEGWDIEWPPTKPGEARFDMKSCIYAKMCAKYGCPELCTVFCRNDDTAFEGYLPKIRFERSGTIGEGRDRCDFHFKKPEKG